ncbi:hypothetical protein QTP86_027633 [Hemibagrus guttatus]|nr:hypothetical protein QTP86_027633 [Hemibagrus guttatus]
MSSDGPQEDYCSSSVEDVRDFLGYTKFYLEVDSHAHFPPMLQHHLEANLQQQVVTEGLAQSLFIATEELLDLTNFCSAGASIPLIDP